MCKVVNNRIISIRDRGAKRAVSHGQLSFVCQLGAKTLVRTSLVVKTVLTNTSRISITHVRRTKTGLKLTFRVRSSVLSIAKSFRGLNGPVNDSTRGRGTACIAFRKLRRTGGSMRQLSKRTVGVLSRFRKRRAFLRSLFFCLVGESRWFFRNGVILSQVGGMGSVGRLGRRRLTRLRRRVHSFLIRGVTGAKKRLTSGLNIVRLAVTLRLSFSLAESQVV